MKPLIFILLLFATSGSAKAQDSKHSLLVVERTTYLPDSSIETTNDYKITHYTENDTINLTEASSAAINQILKVLSRLKDEGWSIVSTTNDFYPSSVSDTLFKSKSWKSKLKSIKREIPFILIPCASPFSSSEKRAKALAFISWYSHFMAKVLPL